MPFVHSFTFTPPKRFDGASWRNVRIEQSIDNVAAFTTVETIALTSTDVSPSGFDTDPSNPQMRSITTDSATLEKGYFRVVWLDLEGDASPPSNSVFSPAAPSAEAFATVADVAARLGRTLSDADGAMAGLLLNGATVMIADHAGKNPGDISPVPAQLRFIAIEMVCRAMANPEGIASVSESLGEYSYTRGFRRGAAGSDLMLTKGEELLISRALYGKTTASPRVASVLEDAWPDLLTAEES